MPDIVPEQSVVKAPETVVPKPAEVKPAEKPLGEPEQAIIQKINQDSDPDNALRDIVETQAPEDDANGANTPAENQHEVAWISKYDQDEIKALEKRAHEDPGSLADSDWEQISGNRDEFDEHKYQSLKIDQNNGVQLNEDYQNFINAYEEEQSKLADGTLTKESRIQKLKQDTYPDDVLRDIAESEKKLEYHVSNHDRAIVIAMMNPEQRMMGSADTVSIYDTLVGEKPKSERSHWKPEDQRLAQEGMAELIATELDEVIPSGQTVDITRARQYIKFLSNPQYPDNKIRTQILRSQGKGVKYQNVDADHLDDLQKQGDFLHFGESLNDPNVPDLLPSDARVYVNPKPSAIGHVAAEVIKRAREKGYNPYGKAWDESSSTESISDRRDRILFLPRTQSQVDIVVGALSDIRTEHPELFEDDVPLLSEKTDIPGVGLADEPVQTADFKMSFNSSREEIIREAWNATLGTLTGREEEDVQVGQSFIDRRNILVREAIRDGSLAINEQIVPVFRESIRNLSPKYHISSDNFARNQGNTNQATVAK